MGQVGESSGRESWGTTPLIRGALRPWTRTVAEPVAVPSRAVIVPVPSVGGARRVACRPGAGAAEICPIVVVHLTSVRATAFPSVSSPAAVNVMVSVTLTKPGGGVTTMFARAPTVTVTLAIPETEP